MTYSAYYSSSQRHSLVCIRVVFIGTNKDFFSCRDSKWRADRSMLTVRAFSIF